MSFVKKITVIHWTDIKLRWHIGCFKLFAFGCCGHRFRRHSGKYLIAFYLNCAPSNSKSVYETGHPRPKRAKTKVEEVGKMELSPGFLFFLMGFPFPNSLLAHSQMDEWHKSNWFRETFHQACPFNGSRLLMQIPCHQNEIAGSLLDPNVTELCIQQIFAV